MESLVETRHITVIENARRHTQMLRLHLNKYKESIQSNNNNNNELINKKKYYKGLQTLKRHKQSNKLPTLTPINNISSYNNYYTSNIKKRAKTITFYSNNYKRFTFNNINNDSNTVINEGLILKKKRIPKLKLEHLNHLKIKSKSSKSEPASSRNAKPKYLPKLQCLKSHRKRNNINNNNNININKKLNNNNEDEKINYFETNEYNNICNRWFEMKFLLRNPINNIEQFYEIKNIATNSLNFLIKLSQIAKELNVLKGTLSRELLPFNSNTNVSDQASYTNILINNNNSKLIKLIDINTRNEMINNAIMLRKLVRVKIADDADLDQARTACIQIKNLCNDIQKYSNKSNIHINILLNSLKNV